MAAISPAPVPTISGTAVFGYTLSAVTGTWATGTTFTYQWNRNGVAISGATASTYTLVLDDVSYPITVTVTGAKAGYDNTSRTSSATALVTNLLLPAKGDNNWDVPLNNALTNLDDRVSNLQTSTKGTVTGIDSIANLDYLQFDTTNVTSPTTPGRLAWNGTDGTLDLYLKDGAVTLQVGQELLARALNKTGSAIAEGAVVRVSGAQGQRLTVSLASPTSDTLSATTLGVVTQEGGIANNGEGYVTLLGLVHGLNTSAFQDGDVLWLGANGTFTATKPTAPTHLVQVGYVVNAANNGIIYVHIQNGYELEELHNVKITNPQDGQFLKYQASTGLWINSF